MRKLCPNLDNQDGLATVLEVPIPEEMFTNMGSSAELQWANLRSSMKAHLSSGSNNEFMALLKLVGSPLIPLQVHCDNALSRPIKDCSIEASTANYIVQQYVAATGGLAALNSVNSMCAVGEVKMVGSEMHQGDNDSVHVQSKGNGEVGGFVLWQKDPDLWYLELFVSGFKVSAGSDGKVAWNQCGSQPCHANKGLPRPLRRFFQGLDPRRTANLFLDAVCTGEKSINKEECFILKLETPTEILQSQSTPQTEIVHHTIWGYFSQRTGLLIQFEDSKLVKMRSRNDSVFWETTMETVIGDYRYVDGINIAHAGKTSALLYRYGHAYNQKRRIEETWKIDEVDFNIRGLSTDCFLPPADLKREDGGGDQ
ncbi:hypothetical protein D8674_032873 [Pyrus ussuriensis x Pyrus communis]|uniref:DUF620 domain-containing protein n=1 Tax=Pyrus ussuriensis x Pyrus communis TaxID=2448454 RepID=A0A5N5HKB3_9ROSA|nr:uncharacterized protein LOC103955490 [Pyrus x bretschneideri]KAB2628078.1 hypothetical protein D8674_032873 [Pyrus ussuriensis x Pyrus communis]